MNNTSLDGCPWHLLTISNDSSSCKYLSAMYTVHLHIPFLILLKGWSLQISNSVSIVLPTAGWYLNFFLTGDVGCFQSSSEVCYLAPNDGFMFPHPWQCDSKRHNLPHDSSSKEGYRCPNGYAYVVLESTLQATYRCEVCGRRFHRKNHD